MRTATFNRAGMTAPGGVLEVSWRRRGRLRRFV